MATAREKRITWHCFLIDSTTELLVTVVLPDVVKTMGRPSSDSSQRYWCSLGKITLNHAWNLPATSQMHIRSLGLTWELAFYAPSALCLGALWCFFVHPSEVTISIGKSFIHPFQLWTLMICRAQPIERSGVYFQSLIQSLFRIIIIICWHLRSEERV